MDSADGVAVSVSVDLELAIGRQTTQGQERLEALTAGLVEILDTQGISATWGVSNPALSAARDVILSTKSRQEIAVLGERFWLGDGTSPSRLAQEFERRFEGARRAGLEVSTLMLRETAEHLDLNLLLRHGVQAVRGPAIVASAEAISRSTAMRFGIWQAQRPILVPLSGSWWQAEPWAFQQRLKWAEHGKLSLNLVLDAGKMAELPDLGLSAMAKVVRQIGQMAERQPARFVTLRELALQNLSRRTSQPSRSVLAA